MSSDNARKKRARRHQAATGDSYTRSRRLTNDHAPEPPPSAEDAARAAEVLAMLNIESRRNTPDFTAAWKTNAAQSVTSSTGPTPVLHVPLGLQPDGTALPLTLGQRTGEFAGSHGILIGTAGSGKTVALQSLVFALCARYSPEMVQLVLIGAKPHSSAFTPFADYPHITHIGDRADGEQAAVLRNLMHWRSEAVERHGRPPVPHMVVIIDDFADVLDADAEFPEAVQLLMRAGRSLDIHLLVATQGLSAGAMARLSRNARYRIAMRVNTEQESRDVIGTADAGHIPLEATGSGFYCVRPDAAPVRFRVVSTPRSLIRAVGRQLAHS